MRFLFLIPFQVLAYLTMICGYVGNAAMGVEADSIGGEAGNIAAWEFRDDVVDLPPYPGEKNLVPVHIDTPHAHFRYFIDPDSIQIGTDRVAVRATIVIQAESGFRNIYFEGFRCDSREFITYAYGTGDKTFYKLHDPEWKVVKQRTGTGLDYRRDMLTAYLCHTDRHALTRDEILHRVRFPEDIPLESGGL